MVQKYFNSLNYTLGNEDTTVEIELVKKIKPTAIFSVCGSGGRSIPLVNKDVEKLYLCDLSEYQLMLAELRYVTYTKLSHNDFLIFWGYCPYGDTDYSEKRKEIFNSLTLAQNVRDFFEALFLELEYSSLLYLGKWEKTFQTLAKICSIILGESAIERLFSFRKLEDQVQYYRNEFPIYKWKLILFLLGNKSVFNALLYKGDFIKKNDPDSHYQYYFNAFDRLFTTTLARNSFFLNLCFFGKIKFHEGNPVEASRETKDRVSEFSGEVEYVKQDMISFLNTGTEQFDFLSLSDVPSYFSGDIEKNYLQMIRPSLKAKAIIVVRYYLRKCEADTSGYLDVTNEYSEFIRQEKVQMYKFCIYQLI